MAQTFVLSSTPSVRTIHYVSLEGKAFCLALVCVWSETLINTFAFEFGCTLLKSDPTTS